MRLSTKGARLIERKSDERDQFLVVNSLRDTANARGTYAASLTTTDATPSEIWRGTVNADSSMVLRVTVAAQALAADFAGYDRRYVISRTGSANAVIQQTDTIGTDFETAAAWDIGLSVSTGDVVLSVTGAAATTVTWRADITAVWSPFE